MHRPCHAFLRRAAIATSAAAALAAPSHGGSAHASRRRSRLAALACASLLAVLQAGCATMSQTQCLGGDWGRAGYDDGVAGYPASRLDAHEKACAAHGVRADATAYLDARERGLRQYCTPSRGYLAGSDGRSYANVCPPQLERAFLAGYTDGRRIHDAKQHVHDLAAETSRLERTIRNLRKDIARAETRLAANDTSESERTQQREDLRSLRRDLGRAEDDLRRADKREHAARHDLQQLEYDLEPRHQRRY